MSSEDRALKPDPACVRAQLCLQGAAAEHPGPKEQEQGFVCHLACPRGEASTQPHASEEVAASAPRSRGGWERTRAFFLWLSWDSWGNAGFLF